MNFRLTAFLLLAISTINANNANRNHKNNKNHKHGHKVVSQPAQANKPAAVVAANVTKSANATSDDLDFAAIKQAEAIISDLDEIHGFLGRFRTDLKNPAVFKQMLKLDTSALLKLLASINVTDSQDKVNANFNKLLDEFQALASKTDTKADDKAVNLLGKLQASVVSLKASVAAADSSLRTPAAAALKKLDAPVQAGIDELEKALAENKDSSADIKNNLLPSLKTDVKALQASIEQVADQLKSVIAVAKANLKAANKKANK